MNSVFSPRWLTGILLAVGCVGVECAAAGPPPITFQQHRIGRAVVSLPPHWMSLGPNVPIWLHLHGAPTVVEANFGALGAPGVLVNVTLPGLSKVYADHFADPSVLPALLRDVQALLRRMSDERPWQWGTLTVSSFSAGFGGVRQLLRHPADFDRIDALVMADSIYCGYAGNPADRKIDEDLMAGFLRFARQASEGTKRFVISHSRQIPEGYASTTETADYLIRQLQGTRDRAEAEEWPGGLHLRTRFSRGNFEVLGFDGDTPEDHMRHLRAIAALLRRIQPAR